MEVNSKVSDKEKILKLQTYVDAEDKEKYLFIKERLTAGSVDKGHQTGAPDLAVEVLSPSDRMPEARKKAKAWLAAGAAMVWLVNPARRTVTICRTAASPETLTETDELDGQDVVPGFRCRVAELFTR